MEGWSVSLLSISMCLCLQAARQRAPPSLREPFVERCRRGTCGLSLRLEMNSFPGLSLTLWPQTALEDYDDRVFLSRWLTIDSTSRYVRHPAAGSGPAASASGNRLDSTGLLVPTTGRLYIQNAGESTTTVSLNNTCDEASSPGVHIPKIGRDTLKRSPSTANWIFSRSLRIV